MVQELLRRTQAVTIAGCISEQKPIKFGVPQGSVMGPLLFIMFINYLHIKKAKITLYTDDTAIFYTSKQINEIESVLNEELEFTHKWLYKNKFTLNVAKTKSVVFGTKRKLSN